jgi:hypothetical protein
MVRMVKRLTGLEIDEVSLVNRPANQHGLVAIAKSQQEDSMSVYDAGGDEVFEEELTHGDHVYDETGAEYVFVEDGQEAIDDSEQVEDEEDEEPQAVGKGVFPLSGAKVKAAGRLGRGAAKDAGAKAKKFGSAHKKEAQFGGIAGGLVGAGAAGGYAAGRVKKSLGTQVLEELSKALTDDDRNQVFAKAADQFDEISKRNDELEQLVMGLYNDRDEAGYNELAKSYELPVDPDDIGGIMFRASQVLPEEDLAVLDRVFSSVGQISKAAMTEIGYGGGMESDVLAQIFAVAGEAVSKSESSMSQEQAVTALFAANPDAYDEYESEQRRN